MRCSKCGTQAFLLLGMCAECAPEDHARYKRAYDASLAMFNRFEKEQGKPVLSDWSGFEKWLVRQPDYSKYVATVSRVSHRAIDSGV